MASGPSNLLNLERVSKSYGVRPLLTEVSLGVGAGERIGVVGRNGDGKTTLLNVMTGVAEPDGGRVSRQRGLLIGHLRQHDELVDTHTVREAVLAGRSDHVFRQPSSRDTGLALYVALSIIKRWTPNALITITPTDHYVAPAARYVEQVRIARGLAARMRDAVVLVGAPPTEPDPELGYLTLGERVTDVPEVHSVAGFVHRGDFGNECGSPRFHKLPSGPEQAKR